MTCGGAMQDTDYANNPNYLQQMKKQYSNDNYLYFKTSAPSRVNKYF